MIVEIKEILKKRNPKELDRLELCYENLNLDGLNINEVAYLFEKANLKINKVTGHYTIEEKAKLLIEYLKIKNIMIHESKRNKLKQNSKINLMYWLENTVFEGGDDDEED